MFMNLHTLPADQAMFTLFLSPDKVKTKDSFTEEIDVVAPRHSSRLEILKLTEQERTQDYDPSLQVVGISNQSDGCWLWVDEGWR